jgi:hypothetical protein
LIIIGSKIKQGKSIKMQKNMKTNCSVAIVISIILLSSCSPAEDYRTLTVDEYQSKMKAGWLGQMAGVGWGAPTEFKFNAMIIPEDQVPAWEPNMINQQYQDDIYVEMTFLKTLEDYGFDVTIRQAGIDFANSKYMLWHANLAGRDNLRAGIAPPYSGHPKFNAHADDIDYQIEADYSGLIAPGMPQTVIDLGEKFGHLMNYGDGVYGGIFVGAMYAEAFFESDIVKIIEAGLACIPAESQYAEVIKDVIKWHDENPENWQKTWQLIEDKYNLNPDYRKFSCNGTATDFNIDAKLNGAYIVMGLLYGKGDMDQTIIISMRCGMDSDCNPSNAAGILATSLGLENLPEKYKTGIDDTTKFSFTAYDFPSLLIVCESLTRDAVVRAGGKIEKNSKGIEEFIIPVQTPVVAPLEQCWKTDEITVDVNFTLEEMEKITVKIRKPEEFVNVWQVAGPFSQDGVEDLGLFDLKFGPEKDQNYSNWIEMPVGKKGYEANIINLEKFFGSKHSIAYLKTNVWIRNNQKVLFEIGSDDGIKVWLNDKLVHSKNIMRGHNQAEDIVAVSLKEGWNTVLMKITQGTGGWCASLVITDLNGEWIDGLKYKSK